MSLFGFLNRKQQILVIVPLFNIHPIGFNKSLIKFNVLERLVDILSYRCVV